MVHIIPKARAVKTGYVVCLMVRRANGTMRGSGCGRTIYSDKGLALFAAHHAAMQAHELLSNRTAVRVTA